MIQRYSEYQPPKMILVGTKLDLVQDIEKIDEKIEEFKQKHKIQLPFIKTSAKESINVEEALNQLLNQYKTEELKKFEIKKQNKQCNLM